MPEEIGDNRIVEWRPHPGKQTEFLSSGADEIFYGGAVGGGKSECILMGATRYIGERDYNAMLFRRTYPELERTLIARSHRYFTGSAKWSDNKKRWTFPSGATIGFGHLERESNVYDHQSAEYQYLGFDELGSFTKFQYEYLKTRWRNTNPRIKKVIRSGGNPVGIGKQWIKQTFIKGRDPMQIYYNPLSKTSSQFIPAFLEDNPTLYLGDPSYAAQLENMSDKRLAQALRWGDWSGLDGAYFDDFWLEKDGKPWHRIPNYFPTEEDEIFGSMDWGYDPDAFCYHLHAMKRISLLSGSFTRIITFMELYGTKKDPSQWAEIIKGIESKLPKQVRIRYLDPSAFNKDPKGGSSVADSFRSNGVSTVKANNDRAMGWQSMRDWMGEAIDGNPSWQITVACPHLLDQIADAERDPMDSFDILGGMDHARDTARYFLISRTPTRWKKEEEPIRIIKGDLITPEMFLKAGKSKQLIKIGGFLLKDGR